MGEGVSLGKFCVLRETAKSLKVKGTDGIFWVPKSVIHDDSEVYKTETSGDLVVEEWWAIRNDFL